MIARSRGGDRHDTSGTNVGWLAACIVIVAINTWASLSSVVVRWLSGGDDDEGGTWVPRVVLWILENRPDVGDADLHVAMWLVAGAVTTLAVGASRRSAWWVAALWVWSLLLEWLQPMVSTVRGSEWTDAVGNTVGIAAGMSVVQWKRVGRVVPWARVAVVGAAWFAATVAMWSVRVQRWWGDQSGLRTDPAVPGVLKPSTRVVLAARPDTGEADAHVLVWALVGVVVVWAVGSTRVRWWATALTALLVVSLAVEALQPVVSGRSARWSDSAGNVVGVGVAAVVGAVARALTVRRRRSVP